MKQNTFTPITEDNTLLMQFVTKSLLELGIKPNLKGFKYLKEAIYLHSDIIYTNKRVNYIYTVIAEKFGVSAGSVTRAISASINISWSGNTLNRSHKLFESAYIDADYPPSNTLFIATMAEIVKLSIGKSRLTGNLMTI